jgi:hypothetical protein
MDSAVLSELLEALPEWASRLQEIAHARFPDHGGVIAAVNPGTPDPPKQVIGPKQVRVPQQVIPREPVEIGQKKANAKPSSTKAKFSSITGPDIYYDGPSQKCFFECWTALNSKRGFLRKEMMQIKRKRVLTLPTYGYSDSEEEEELEAEDESSEDSEEQRLRQEEEERQKAEEEKRRQEHEKKGVILEYIDSCLDKAAKACENAAFLWLKGEGCTGHVVFIVARMMEAIDRIHIEKNKDKPKIDEGIDDEDEGFGDELEAGDHFEDEELPHKKAGQMPEQSERRYNLSAPALAEVGVSG